MRGSAGYRVWIVAIALVLAPAALQAQAIETWKGLVVAGSYTDGSVSIQNWDNARRELVRLFEAAGMDTEHVRALSATPELAYTEEGGVLIEQASRFMIEASLQDLELSQGDALFLFMTSHGYEGDGFALEWERDRDPALQVAQLDAMLDQHLGETPAVILISACFSGQFVSGVENIRGRNRVILTAARADRSSFGCGAGSRMPEWDETVIRLLNDGGPYESWAAFFAAVEADIAAKEKYYADSERSLPQASIPSAADELLSSFFARLR